MVKVIFQFRLSVLLIICFEISFKVRTFVIFRVIVSFSVRLTLWLRLRLGMS